MSYIGASHFWNDRFHKIILFVTFSFKIIIVISFKIIMNLEEHMPQALLFTSERYVIPSFESL